MKVKEDWALVPVGAQMRLEDLVSLQKSKHYPCLWLLFLVVDFSLWCWQRKGSFGIGEVLVYFFPVNCVFVSSQYGPVSYQVEIFIISLILLNKSKGVLHLVSNKSSLFGLKSRITFVNRVLLRFKSSCWFAQILQSLKSTQGFGCGGEWVALRL